MYSKQTMNLMSSAFFLSERAEASKSLCVRDDEIVLACVLSAARVSCRGAADVMLAFVYFGRIDN